MLKSSSSSSACPGDGEQKENIKAKQPNFAEGWVCGGPWGIFWVSEKHIPLSILVQREWGECQGSQKCICVCSRGWKDESHRAEEEDGGNGLGVGAEDGCGAYTTLNVQYDLSLTLNDENGKILIQCSFGLVPSWTRKKEKQISNYLQPMEYYSENK